MKIIKNNCKKRKAKFTCPKCFSELELTLKDIQNYRDCWIKCGVHDININYYKCPCCNKINKVASNHPIFNN